MKERKKDHLKISLEEAVEAGSTGFGDVFLLHNALPEVDLEQVETRTQLFGKELEAPIIIEAMTGGTEQALAINEALAAVAEKLRIGIAIGSQRMAIEDPSLESTYDVVAKAAKNTLKIANLGAVQLNYGYSVTECQKAVDMIDADALALHLNPLQEAIQPEGNTNFSDLLPKIREVCLKLRVPVIAKEVGCGISKEVAERLIAVGVRCIDVGGFGGTSWNRIERYRAEGERKKISEEFDDWGIPTAVSLLGLRGLGCSKIASGGIRTGVDAAKAIALGADAIGLALPLLKALDKNGEEGVFDYLHQLIEELKIAMFLTGSRDIRSMQRARYRVAGRTAKIV